MSLHTSSHLSKIAFSGGKVQVAFRSEARNARSGAVGPDARKASPQRRGVLDVRRRRRRAKPDKADGPTPPALPRRGGGMFKLAQEGAAREAGQKRKGHGEKSPCRIAFPFVGLLEPWPVRLLTATTWRRAFVMVPGNLVSKPSDSCPHSSSLLQQASPGKLFWTAVILHTCSS
jgi:hypothetical protein